MKPHKQGIPVIEDARRANAECEGNTCSILSLTDQEEPSEFVTSIHLPNTKKGQPLQQSNSQKDLSFDPSPMVFSSLGSDVAVSDVPGDILYQWRLRRRLEQARREATAGAKLQSGQKLVASSRHKGDNCTSYTGVVKDEDVNAIPKEQIRTVSGQQDKTSPKSGSKTKRGPQCAPRSECYSRCNQESHYGCYRCAHHALHQCVPSHSHWSCDVLPCQQRHPPAELCLSNRTPSNRKNYRRSRALQEPRKLKGSTASFHSTKVGRGPPTSHVNHSQKRQADIHYPDTLPLAEPPLGSTSTSEWCSSPSPRNENSSKQPSDQGFDHSLLSQVISDHLLPGFLVRANGEGQCYPPSAGFASLEEAASDGDQLLAELSTRAEWLRQQMRAVDQLLEAMETECH